MTRAFVAKPLVALVLLTAAPPGAAAQWVVGADITTAKFWGGSAEVAGDRSFRPYRPTFVGVGVERRGGRIGIGVRGYFASSSLALEGDEAIVVGKSAFDVYGVVAEASVALGRLGESAVVVARAGPVLESWKPDGQPSVFRAGFGGSVGLQVALGERWSGVVGAGAAVTGSPFTREDLDPAFHPRALWRREVRGTLQYRL